MTKADQNFRESRVDTPRSGCLIYTLENNPEKIWAAIGLKSCSYLTDRFNVALHLFSNRSQMTSKVGNNKKSGTRGDSRMCH